MKKYLELFLSFFKTGLFTFGGGYAMISLLEVEFVERKKWIEHDEFMDVVVIAESTPGPIAINSATYIGYKVAGVGGSVLSTLGVCLPSFIIIYLISLFFDRFLALEAVAAAFRGIQVAVVYLIFQAGLKMLRKMKKTPLSVALVAVAAGALITLTLFSVKFSTVFYILIGALVGVIYYLITRIRERGGEGR
ncbi:MAG: chromate transporter [Clostridia bacterium]|nr:chromate transporter [Clostridia bacterium]